MVRSVTVAALAALLNPLAAGQEPDLPRFDVVSVKPAPPGGGPMGIGFYTYPGGRILATSYTLRQLIHDAYDLEMYRIVGGPHWADEDRFDVEAKPPESSPSSQWAPANFKSPPNPEMRLMLRALLADRFQLKVHTETRKESVYALVVAKGGPRLKEPASTKVQPFVSFRPHGLAGQNATVDQLIERLTSILKRPVLNQTALRGNFDFVIDYGAPDDTGTDLVTLLLSALPEQAGLKLESRPGSVNVVAIDQAEKPSGN